jgi:hypothetical protein
MKMLAKRRSIERIAVAGDDAIRLAPLSPSVNLPAAANRAVDLPAQGRGILRADIGQGGPPPNTFDPFGCQEMCLLDRHMGNRGAQTVIDGLRGDLLHAMKDHVIHAASSDIRGTMPQPPDEGTQTPDLGRLHVVDDAACLRQLLGRRLQLGQESTSLS